MVNANMAENVEYTKMEIVAKMPKVENENAKNDGAFGISISYDWHFRDDFHFRHFAFWYFAFSHFPFPWFWKCHRVRIFGHPPHRPTFREMENGKLGFPTSRSLERMGMWNPPTFSFSEAS